MTSDMCRRRNLLMTNLRFRWRIWLFKHKLWTPESQGYYYYTFIQYRRNDCYVWLPYDQQGSTIDANLDGNSKKFLLLVKTGPESGLTNGQNKPTAKFEVNGQFLNLTIRRFEFWRFDEWPWPFAVLENLKIWPFVGLEASERLRIFHFFYR